jgi:hypothetical protein
MHQVRLRDRCTRDYRDIHEAWPMMDNFVKATIQYSPISEPKNPFMLECFTIRTIQIIYIDDLIRIKVLPGNQDIQETMINVAALICIMVLPTNQDYKLSSKY